MTLANDLHHEKSVHNCRSGVSLPRGLVAMRTKAELHTNLETTTAYVVEIPVKDANTILKCVGQTFDLHSAD